MANSTYVPLVFGSSDHLSQLLGDDIRWWRAKEAGVPDEELGEAVEVYKVDIA